MNVRASSYVVVYITCGSHEEATTIARDLVESRLIACANLVPGVTSIYRWEGKVESDQEVLLIAKTRQVLFPKLAERVTQLHSYDLPEVIALPLQAGLEGYLKWIDEECVDEP